MVNGLGLLFMKVTFGASSSNSRLTKVTFWLTMYVQQCVYNYILIVQLVEEKKHNIPQPTIL